MRLLRLRSDEQLVALFRAGSEEAFQVIHDRYRQRLFAYTRQMLAGSRQDAEDALQDVFLRAYGALRASERPISLRAWLYRVAHNRCIDQLRRPVPAAAEIFEVSRSPLHDPLAEAERRDDLRRLIEDVRRLPEGQRSALLMREMEGLSYEELAAALETTVPAIKSLLVRARIGLVEAAEARDTACSDIRNQLLAAYDKGVRASGQARRHMRECAACREYRTELRAVQRSFAALAPPAGLLAGPLGLLAKLGIGSSAAGGGAGAAAGGGGAGAAGACAASGGVVAAGKVVAVVCSVAVVTGGVAQEVKQQTQPAKAATSHTRSAPTAGHHAAASIARPKPHLELITGAVPLHAAATHRKRSHHKAQRTEEVELAPIRPNVVAADPAVTATPVVATDPRVDSAVTGGAVAPDEPETPATDTTSTDGSGNATPSDSATTPLSTVTGPGTGADSGSSTAQPAQGSGPSGSSDDDGHDGAGSGTKAPRR